MYSRQSDEGGQGGMRPDFMADNADGAQFFALS